MEIANHVMGKTICAFGDGMSMPMLGLVRRFRDEFADAAKNGLAESRPDDSTEELVRASLA